MRKVKIKENINNADEFNLLYDAVGWGAFDSAISQKAMNNTFYSVSIYDNEKIIGYGRIIGDGICFLYIQDIMVMPEYQNNKIGTMIMEKLIEKIKKIQSENPHLRVYLGASKGKENFYKKFGFVRRIDAGLGAGMILNSKNI